MSTYFFFPRGIDFLKRPGQFYQDFEKSAAVREKLMFCGGVCAFVYVN